jgi:hypothetical protein
MIQRMLTNNFTVSNREMTNIAVAILWKFAIVTCMLGAQFFFSLAVCIYQVNVNSFFQIIGDNLVPPDQNSETAPGTIVYE